MEESFVYKSAAGAADPLGDGKGNEDHVRQRGRAASSVQGAQPNFVYKSLGAPAGFGESLEDSFVYKSAAGAAEALGDGKGNQGYLSDVRAAAPVQAGQPNFVYKPLGAPTGFGQSMEDQFVYQSAAGRAEALGDGKG